jgi:hypothetical protein
MLVFQYTLLSSEANNISINTLLNKTSDSKRKTFHHVHGYLQFSEIQELKLFQR